MVMQTNATTVASDLRRYLLAAVLIRAANDGASVLGAGRGRHGVVVGPTSCGRDMRCGLDQFMVDAVGLCRHLLVVSLLSGDVGSVWQMTRDRGSPTWRPEAPA